MHPTLRRILVAALFLAPATAGVTALFMGPWGAVGALWGSLVFMLNTWLTGQGVAMLLDAARADSPRSLDELEPEERAREEAKRRLHQAGVLVRFLVKFLLLGVGIVVGVKLGLPLVAMAAGSSNVLIALVFVTLFLPDGSGVAAR